MKALLALMALMAALPLPFHAGDPATPIPETAPLVLAEIPLDDPPPCDGCVPQIRLVVDTPPPVPCLDWTTAIQSFKVLGAGAQNRKGDCGICVDPARNICEFNPDGTCTVHATVQITLNPGYNFSQAGYSPWAFTTILGSPKCAGQALTTAPLQVYHDSCPFKLRIEYLCGKCDCPPPPSGDA